MKITIEAWFLLKSVDFSWDWRRTKSLQGESWGIEAKALMNLINKSWLWAGELNLCESHIFNTQYYPGDHTNDESSMFLDIPSNSMFLDVPSNQICSLISKEPGRKKNTCSYLNTGPALVSQTKNSYFGTWLL